ncbi:unnamed protein product [Hermetia illucens]|uniref:Uncharacterized protein n=1 Tax=Hermetia illucens TaxID=343691 RepID=A0A7R8UYW2_HERIL|nr:unnamed protein product [Hermetia illucens]
MSPEKVIFNDLDLHGIGYKGIGMGLALGQEVEGKTSKEGVDAWGLAGFIEDLIGNVLRAILVLKDVGAVAKYPALYEAESLHLGWGAIGPENEAEDEEWADKLFIAKQLNLSWSRDVVFKDRIQGPEGTSCTA